MSEPLSSSEIEDVLSSIRRLVSEDMRPQTAAPVPTRPVKVAPPQPDSKLILTPALRVVQSHHRAEPPMFVATPRVDYAVEPREPAPIETVLASLGAGVDNQDDEWEAEVGDAAPVAADMANAPMMAPEHFEFMVQQQIVAEEAAETFDPAFDEAEAGFVEMAEEGEHEFIEEAAEEKPAEPMTPAWAQMSDIEDFTPRAATETVQPPAEPDADWAAAAEASVIAALEAEAQEAVSQQLHARFDDAEANEPGQGDFRIDEEQLRELVRDVLREELAGRIGERITRNIRKLVRAEIAMTLAAQELS